MKLLQERTISLSITIISVIIVCGIIWPNNFLTIPNFKSVLINMSIRAIVAVGMMNLLISGYMDLSVGAVLALSGGVSAALIIKAGFGPVPAIIIALLMGCLVGIFNGFMVAKVGINPMIQTLAMQNICNGLCLIIAGPTLTGLPRVYTQLGQKFVAGIQMPILFMIIIVLIMVILNEKTVFFRRNYFIGGNERAAKLSGINVTRMTIFNYVLMGLLAAFAGILTAARLGTASSTAGTGMEMKCISACVLGGASIKGGDGRIIGALLGIFFMGLLDNIIIIAGVPVEWNNVISGAVLVLAVTLDVLLKKKKA